MGKQTKTVHTEKRMRYSGSLGKKFLMLGGKKQRNLATLLRTPSHRWEDVTVTFFFNRFDLSFSYLEIFGTQSYCSGAQQY